MSYSKRSIPLVLSIFLMVLTVASGLLAAVDKATLKIKGETIDTLGRKACDENSTEQVEVVLPNSALKGTSGDFRALFSPVKQSDKSKTDSLCDEKITDSASLTEEFTKGKPKIPLNKFLKRAQCESDAEPGKRVLCIYDENKALVSYAIFNYDTTIAKIEGITERSAVNGEVSFKVKTSGTSGSFKIRVCYGKDDEDAKKIKDAPSCTENNDIFKRRIYRSTNIVVPNLDNGARYGFRVMLIDSKDGDSKWFEPFYETPEPVSFPLNGYNGAGGDLSWGCQHTNSGSMGFFITAVLMMMLVRMRTNFLSKKSWTLIVVVSTIPLSYAPESHAEFGQMNVGILGAMYRPDLDNESTAGNTIFPFYKCYFRKKTSDPNGPINPLMGVEIDWHLWDNFGSLQLGFGTSYTFTTGRALKLDANNQPDCDAPVDNTSVSLHMYQLRPQLTYVFNPFAEYFPFVPYVRGALIGHGYMFFSNGKNESLTAAHGSSMKPNGFRFGYQAAVGMMLMLDFLEPSAVRSARGEGLFEHVYLKGELSYTQIDTFGRPGLNFSSKDVMGTTWPLMWTFGLVFELP